MSTCFFLSFIKLSLLFPIIKTRYPQEAHNPLYGFSLGGAKYVLSDWESDCPDGQNDSELVDKILFAGLTS